MSNHIKTSEKRVDLHAKNRTDSRMICRRPDLSIYAIVSRRRWCELRDEKRLESFLDGERDSGVILELS